ncbi:hypothetical protein [Amylibacter sp. IMCC11727]|uniref:hypothetical protein n=1 Tax=Amylibacter sp. IMCC11727 TaxID=3039851 RepID=UPI00244E0FE0|nr:hypothetical protein [Amylibacter sp. IMCC11727]WGI23464.1 hypothetical protein QBD29_08560 [Amylibacter sp. IMCC11727]
MRAAILSLIVPLLAVAACDTPRFGFQYDQVDQLSVAGNDYKVYYTKTEAQAVRLNRVGIKSLQTAADAGVLAIKLATQCDIKRVDPKSDPVLIIARINCADPKETSG